MTKTRSPDWENIKKEYIKLNGDVKLKEFAKEHGVKYSTLRSRKNRESWDSEINKDIATKSATQQKTVATENNIISWVEIENEYVTDIRRKPCTLKDLSQKYNIEYKRVREYAAENNWTGKRDKYRTNIGQKAAEKTAELISSEIAKYKAKHLNISDKLLGYLDEALSDKTELYKHVAKLRTGYGPGEFNEKITSETLDNINDSKLLNMVNALSKLQKIQRQTLGIFDEKDKLQYGLNREKLDFQKAQKSNNQDDKPIEILIKRKGED